MQSYQMLLSGVTCTNLISRLGPDPIKVFSASIDATLKFQPIKEGRSGHEANLIGWNFSVASIEAEKSFIGLGPDPIFPGLALWCSRIFHEKKMIREQVDGARKA